MIESGLGHPKFAKPKAGSEGKELLKKSKWGGTQDLTPLQIDCIDHLANEIGLNHETLFEMIQGYFAENKPAFESMVLLEKNLQAIDPSLSR